MNILVISDLQAPFHHVDAIDFLKAVKSKFNTKKVVCIGDETDNYFASSYAKSPDMFGAGEEVALATKTLQRLYKLFPEVTVVYSNHLDRIQKAANNSNLPKQLLKQPHEIFKAPKGWKWVNSHRIKHGKHETFFTHGRTKDLSWAKSMGMNIVQGHHHESFQIIYFRPNNEDKSTSNLRWSMFVGCLIDDETIPFGYNKNNKLMPILGCAVIINGTPMLIPMHLDKKCRWTGSL